MSTTNPTSETTEWDDLQRKFGNLPPLEKEIKEEEIYLKNIDKLENVNPLEKKNLNELTLIEENCIDEEYLKIIEKYKTDRINEINRNRAFEIYGELYDISKDNFLREINEASKRNPLNEYMEKTVEESTKGDEDEEEYVEYDEGDKYQRKDEEAILKKKKSVKGTHVVLHLYSDNVISCTILNNILKQMANKHKYIKFTKGVYNKIIENYPESKLPTILIYYNGSCIHQICNMVNYIKGGTNKLNIKSVEKFLSKYDILKHNNYMHSEGRRNNENSPVNSDANSNTNSYASSDDDNDNNNNNESYKKKKIRSTKKHYTSFNMFRSKYKTSEDEEGDFSSHEKNVKSIGYSSSLLDNKIKRSNF
ncbi:phosducin-like protein 1 [Plasmodium brasilianum]|uniref:Phosducin-like protein, putative n=2 Tax=Plasmodium (Plasmodium) TaxID=418103 RepID=A0A1A8W0E3_PLAMA|nr:phosducin-like protein, putative [Plasmodium malariae]KAI4837814.1 phosducin-like protein 1 [Plasmodium brasilianum]SBS86350.1 hypothetical protein PMALA_015760 [Plasmodium malariae]SCN44862.1 phosducin-like protein, putative [Plasmodium malariae]